MTVSDLAHGQRSRGAVHDLFMVDVALNVCVATRTDFHHDPGEVRLTDALRAATAVRLGERLGGARPRRQREPTR